MDYQGRVIGFTEGETRSSDYGSCGTLCKCGSQAELSGTLMGNVRGLQKFFDRGIQRKPFRLYSLCCSHLNASFL